MVRVKCQRFTAFQTRQLSALPLGTDPAKLTYCIHTKNEHNCLSTGGKKKPMFIGRYCTRLQATLLDAPDATSLQRHLSADWCVTGHYAPYMLHHHL